MRIARVLLTALTLALGTMAHAETILAETILAETNLANPPPSLDHPRKIVFQLTSDSPKEINNLLSNSINLQKFYDQDRVEIVVVVFGKGMKALYKDTSPVTDRIRSLMHYDIKFIGCANTMETTGHKPAELIEGVQVVKAGIAEIVERQLNGWIYIRP